jgi:predicted O-methyltransferase YrrM
VVDSNLRTRQVTGASTVDVLDWKGNAFALGETTFRVGYAKGGKTEQDEFLLFKPKWMVEQYAQLIRSLQPKHIFELGIYRGGSLAFLSLLAQPRKYVAIDLRGRSSDLLETWLDSHDLRQTVVPHYGVDQADEATLRKLVAEEFSDTPLDLVIDDASHLFEPTRASFNALFPYLRHGGVYVIEDWATGLDFEAWMSTHADAAVADEVAREVQRRREKGIVTTPLTRLVFEVILATAYTDLIDDMHLRRHWLAVTKGSGDADVGSFDISDCYLDRGRRLLSEL